MDSRLALGLLAFVALGCQTDGLLYPKNSESRRLSTLDGVWNFRISDRGNPAQGFDAKWWKKELCQTGDILQMPVPSSYQDITQEKEIRDFTGWAWYDRTFYAPDFKNDTMKRWFIRFGSAQYNTVVWINGERLLNHSGGHMPFEGEVTQMLKYTEMNRVTVAINNTLTQQTLPTGNYAWGQNNSNQIYPKGYFFDWPQEDFFNYAGLHRPVVLYSSPVVRVTDVTIIPDKVGMNGIVHYTVDAEGANLKFSVYLRDRNGTVVDSLTNSDCNRGTLNVENAHFWWPKFMHHDPGYLYDLEIHATNGMETDIYRQKVGIRTVELMGHKFLINGKPAYFRGFGRHEDWNVRGKGLDWVMTIKDFNLIDWTGANAFRTSHYPYSEELMDECDKRGIMVINESPAVGLGQFWNVTRDHHIKVMHELITRDKNRPAVVMWSVGNEPASWDPAAEPYFKAVFDYTRKTDPQKRPVTVVLCDVTTPFKDKIAKFVDVICMNHYFAWYSDTGQTQLIYDQMIFNTHQWNNTYNRPVIVTEYGTETVVGLKRNPSYAFTEDLQVDFASHYHESFDYLRKRGLLIGEMIWNFADFMTAQSVGRVVGSTMGIFTRDRQPKESAWLIRDRYWGLAAELDGWDMSKDRGVPGAPKSRRRKFEFERN